MMVVLLTHLLTTTTTTTTLFTTTTTTTTMIGGDIHTHTYPHISLHSTHYTLHTYTIPTDPNCL